MCTYIYDTYTIYDIYIYTHSCVDVYIYIYIFVCGRLGTSFADCVRGLKCPYGNCAAVAVGASTAPGNTHRDIDTLTISASRNIFVYCFPTWSKQSPANNTNQMLYRCSQHLHCFAQNKHRDASPNRCYTQGGVCACKGPAHVPYV